MDHIMGQSQVGLRCTRVEDEQLKIELDNV